MHAIAKKKGKTFHLLTQLLIAMKFIVIFLTIFVFQSSGKGLSQKVSINLTGAPFEKLLKEIHKQTGVNFFYNSKVLHSAGNITVNIKDAEVETVLKDCLENKPFDFSIVNGTIVITGKVRNVSSISTPAIVTEMPLFPPPVIIKGKVTDEKGKPLPGASILIKNSKTRTQTNEEGEFILNVTDNSAILVISYIGYEVVETGIKNKNNITVVLKQIAQVQQEIIVIGYGTQKKATLTGSVVAVSGDEIKKSPAPNITSSLEGQLPGLIVNQRSGEPGRDDPDIVIRGGSTTGDHSPLIIIDGVERSYMSRMNPEDIDSYTVLKDASAAIYGARAANGVILITTKKGKEGKPVFSLSMNNSFQHPTKVPELLNSYTYATVYNELAWYKAGMPTSGYTPTYSDFALQSYKNGSDPILYPNTNWEKEILKSSSLQTRASLQVIGGSRAVRYMMSGSYMYQNGNYKNNPTVNKQYNMHTSIDAELNKYLTVGVNINAIITDKSYAPVITWTNFFNIVNAAPTLVAVYPNGLIAPGRLGENPLLLNQRGYDKTQETPINSTFTASLKIPYVEGLRLDGSFNYDLNNTFEKLFSQPYSYYEYNVNTKQYDKKQGTGQTTVELTDTYNKYTTMLYNYKFVYDRNFKKHHVGAMLGGEQQSNTWSYVQAYRKNFVSSAIQQIAVGSNASADKNNNGSASNTARNNYFGRFNYDFGSKYLAEFVFRYDGSQNFPSNRRYGFFPAGSVGWRLSEEPFLRKAAPFVDQLKLRVSVGQIGNDKVSSYQYLQTYSFGNNYVLGGTDVSGIYANTMPNPNITWERSTKADFGLDAILWKGLLGVEFTLFNEWRSNILHSRNVTYPNTLGFSSLPDENIGKVNNHGFELKISHKNKIRDLKYKLEGNLSFAKSKIIFIDEIPYTQAYANATGHPLNASLYYQDIGIFHTQAEIDKYPHQSGTQVGDIKVADLNGDGLINSNDQFRFNYTDVPQIVFGFNTNFQYKGFDMTLFFQGQTKAYHYDGQFANLGDNNNDNAFVAREKNHWTVNNTTGTMPRAGANAPGTTTFFLYDATFIRLKTAELGYTLPNKIGSKIGVSDLRVYVSGFNLFTWAKSIKWEDPELSGDALFYPQQRVINLGVNVKF